MNETSKTTECEGKTLLRTHPYRQLRLQKIILSKPKQSVKCSPRVALLLFKTNKSLPFSSSPHPSELSQVAHPSWWRHLPPRRNPHFHRPPESSRPAAPRREGEPSRRRRWWAPMDRSQLSSLGKRKPGGVKTCQNHQHLPKKSLGLQRPLESSP